MRYVVAIAETGGFTRAAERCHVVQSALSHQVARLERELGADLFLRTSRRVELTAAGTAFLPAARSALAAAELARVEVAATTGVLRGTLCLGTVPTFTALDVIELLRRFRDRHPDVEVTMHGMRSEQLVDGLGHGRVDVALIGVPQSYNVPAGVVGSPVAVDEMVLLARPDHPLARRPAGEIGLAEIAGETFADYPAASLARAQTDEAFAGAGLTRRVSYEVDHPSLLQRCARAGLAVALASPDAIPDDPELVRIPLRDPPTRIQMVAWRATPTPAARAFLDLAEIRQPAPSRPGG